MGEAAKKLKHYRRWLYGAVLVGVIFFAYKPAWHGQPLLDDADYLLRDSEMSLRNLLDIWIERPLHQYHPLVGTIFWIGKRLWGGSMLGYHLATIALHATAALLLARVLERFHIPGAWLAAAIFALHPVQVESVAWVVELKNTLSGVLFLACLLAYLKYDEQSKQAQWYILIMVAFLLGMMAKPILATLPAVILIVQWWRDGALQWRKHIALWLPLLILGATAGLFSAWMEQEISGAEREIVLLSPAQKFLVAGRAFCFYLGKIIWPSNLSFMYPRWNMDPSDWRQYLFPLAGIIAFALVWLLRRWNWRAPLAGLLFFFITIFPLLGFFNVSFFRFSFVADHFQYLPIIGIITPISAGCAMLFARVSGWQRVMLGAGCGALLLILTGLSWGHAHDFRDQITCYRAVVKRDPGSWAAHLNLGFDALTRHSSEEAAAHFRAILETNADNPPAAKRAHLALSAMLIGAGRIEEATQHLQNALQIDPCYGEAHANLAAIFLQSGRTREGIAEYRTALECAPQSAQIQLALAWQLATCFDPSLRNAKEAFQLAERARISLGGINALVLRVLAAAHAELGQFREALQLAGQGLQESRNRGDAAFARKIERDIQLYESGRPNHQSLE